MLLGQEAAPDSSIVVRCLPLRQRGPLTGIVALYVAEVGRLNLDRRRRKLWTERLADTRFVAAREPGTTLEVHCIK